MRSIQINLRYSKRLDVLHFCLTILSISCLAYAAILAVVGWITCLLLIIIITVTSYHFSYQNIKLLSKHSIMLIEAQSQFIEWQLTQRDGQIQIAYLLKDSICLPWIVLLHFKLVGKRRRLVMLDVSNVDPGQFKALQRYLNWEVKL